MNSDVQYSNQSMGNTNNGMVMQSMQNNQVPVNMIPQQQNIPSVTNNVPQQVTNPSPYQMTQNVSTNNVVYSQPETGQITTQSTSSGSVVNATNTTNVLQTVSSGQVVSNQESAEKTTDTALPTTEGSSGSNGTQEKKDGVKPKKKRNILSVLLLIIIIGLSGYIYYSYTTHQKEIIRMMEECSPVSTSGETKELDLNSTIVQDLYSKVETNIREDLANFELNDEMKLYLAYRQMPTNKIYDSNCNYFSDTKMYAFSCKERLDFKPTAFKEEDLIIEVKKLFGETTFINHDDIQLSNTCLGGYQYIAERGEYVEGECGELTATTFKASKELIKATSTESTIVLYEKVKYSGTEGKDPPEKLKSGTYKYTFRLDPSYNYVYINKEYEV